MKKIAISFLIPPVLGILGALVTEYVLKIGVLGTSNLIYFVVAGLIGAVIVFILTRKMAFAVPVVIGFILMPYFAFLVGQIDFYMVDANLAEGITVVEVRPTMDKIVFGTDKGDVTVWQGPQTLKLHPGENRAKLGRFDMAAGTYQGGKVYIDDIQVDIRADFSILNSPEGNVIPTDGYAQAFEAMKSQMGGGGNYGGFQIKVINSSLSGSIGTFTISVGSMTQPIPIPQITYPGMGGPDITLDIVLDEMGKPDPSKINAIVDMPPGVGGAFPSMPGVTFR